MKNRFMILCFAVFVLLPSLIFTQTKSGGIIQTNKNPNQAFTKFKNDPPLSAEDQSLLNKIIKIKNSPDLSRSGELNQLLKIYNQRNGIIEKPAENYEGAKIISPEKEIETQTDHVYSGYVKSFATATEQTGTDKGKAWIVYTHGTPGVGGDTLSIYSTTGSGVYEFRGGAILAGTDIFYSGNLDAEIVEKLSGEKYLYVFYSFTSVGSALSKIGGVALDLNTSTISIFYLVWPGQTITDSYYNVHITSDNSVDSSTTWLYISCSVDSIGSGGNLFYGQKFAYVSQTNVAPSINYRANILPVYWQSGDGYIRNLFTDIAYFRDGSDTPSLMFTYSNIPDSTKIWLTKSYFTGASATLWGTLGTSFHISNSNIVAPGGTGNQHLMIVATQNWQNSGDWDLNSYKTIDGGASWAETFIDSYTSTTTRLPSWPDTYVKWKDRNNYRVSYNLGTINPVWLPDSVMFVKSVASPNNQWEVGRRVSTSDVLQPEFISKVGFLGNSSDDCLVLWSDLNLSGLYATYCDITTDVNIDHQSPRKHFLSNNYPNPFNPSTKIEFRISDPGIVSLKVYDLLGREVADLINQEKPTGSYEVTFDASKLPSGVYYYKLSSGSFSETKKMMLFK